MNKKIFSLTAVLLLLLMPAMLCGCGKKSNAAENAGVASNGTPAGTNETAALSDEQALAAIRNYCFAMNPDLEGIVKEEEYPTYWEIAASDEREIVVLFRSYTGALVRYYIDRNTGDTYVTEFVPEVTAGEERTDVSFNVKNYISGN